MYRNINATFDYKVQFALSNKFRPSFIMTQVNVAAGQFDLILYD